jgi:hypothetical protein
MSETSRILKIQALAQGGYEHLVSAAISTGASLDAFGMNLFAEMNREPVLVDEFQNLVAGSILVREYTATPTANAANTGDGEIIVQSVGPDVVEGTYTAVCTSARPDRGIFDIRAPNTGIIGEANVNTAFTSRHLSVTVEDGTVDYVVGDAFTIEVEGAGYAGFDFANASSQVAAGVLAIPINTMDSAGPLEQFAIVRGPALLPTGYLQLTGWDAYWPTIDPAITATEAAALRAGYLSACTAQLQRRGIVVRD